MKPKLGDAEHVFLFRVNVKVVGGAGKSRCLDERTDRSRVVTLDIAFESRAEAFNLPVISWKLSTTASHVHRVSPDELFLPRVEKFIRGYSVYMGGGCGELAGYHGQLEGFGSGSVE